MKPLIIGVDIDDTLNDFKPTFCEEWDRMYPDEIHLSPDELTGSFYLNECYPPDLADKVDAIFLAPGFHRGLKLKPYASEALEQMVADGHKVSVCTAAHPKSPWMYAEKIEWLTRELGMSFAKRTHIANDKTLIDVDVLIDDRPEIRGDRDPPHWKHILFDAPCNRHVTGKPRLTDWRRWREAINEVMGY